jgi:purine-nucleoside/S-methyl-5'-thioadenosine phosphorylase / adenosine deaminase
MWGRMAEIPAIACIQPDWPSSHRVHALTTLRSGGFSDGPYAGFNLATHTGDVADAVARNRRLLRSGLQLPSEPVWLSQVHGRSVLRADKAGAAAEADGSWSDHSGTVCVVLTADCLPLLLCDRTGSRVAAVHAGWRGLHRGIISAALETLSVPVRDLLVWLGPAIGADAFEVGQDVHELFVQKNPENSTAFRPRGAAHWLCDLYALARIELRALGVESVYGGDFCTFTGTEQFYSYRRDGKTGRMASLIWLA